MTRNESYVPLLKSYPDSEKINAVSEGAEAMFCRLLAKCDDAGNFFGSEKRLLCKLYALRYENGTIKGRKVRQYRDELIAAELLLLYEVGGIEYVHIVNCRKSLRKDVAPKLDFPGYVNGDGKVTESARLRNRPVTKSARQSNPIQSNPIQTNVNVTFTLRAFVDQGVMSGLTEAEAEECYHHYAEQDFKYGNGQPIPNIAAVVNRWKRNRHKFKNTKGEKTAAEMVAEYEAQSAQS
jgi:hypothetical protein